MAGLKADDLNGMDVIDVIKMLADKKGDIDKMRSQIIDCLRPLMPRAYSIASSSKTSNDKVDLCVATVRYELGERTYGGVASAYLQDHLKVGDKVKGYFVSNKAFALPLDEAQPVIMIGPGTGLAPFRGFLQEHALKGYTSPTWLFFGDRNQDTDFLYEEELKAYMKTGTLTKLDLAFSRDQTKKVYVQDRMRENAAELFDYLEKDAAVFVCGDAKHMAHDVDLALREIIQTQGNMSAAQADQYLDLMKQDKRYVRDVY